MALSALAFSVMAVCIKLAKQELPAGQIVFVRGVLCAAVTILAMREPRREILGQRRGLLALRGGLGFLGLYLYTLALGRVPLPDAMALQYTHPIFAAAAAALFLRERMPRHSTWALGVCAAGAWIILDPTGTGDLSGNMLGLASGLAAALAYTCVRALHRTESPLTIMLAFHAAAAICGGLLTAGEFVWPTGSGWVLLIAIAVVSQLGQWFLTLGLRREKTGVATTVSYAAIAFGAGWSMLVFDQPVRASVVLGTALMLGGLVLLGRLNRRENRRENRRRPAATSRR